MNEDTRELYEYLDMEDLLPGKGPSILGGQPANPLLEAVTAAEIALETNPGPLLAALCQSWDVQGMSKEALAIYAAQAREALASPLVTRAYLQRIDASFHGDTLPGGFTFPYQSDCIPIDPRRTKFEERADWFRWFLHGVRWWAGDNLPFIPPVEKAPFRWHNHPGYCSRFVYDEPETELSSSCQLALFADFGTGEYQSLYIAEQIEKKRPDMAFHLGDVYYAGKRDEFAHYFASPLAGYAATRPLYVLNENHEMMSGGRDYFNYLDQKQQRWRQQQEGSYFAVRRPPVQVVGIDTAWHTPGRWAHPELLGWLETALREGRERGLVNVLISGKAPYEAGSQALRTLLDRDLRKLEQAELIDFWFWGHDHYGALFDRTDRTRFIGSCIGHGGFPVKRSKNEDRHSGAVGRSDRPAPLLFFERRARFPAWTGVRQDMSNHGYVMLSAASNCEVELSYFDWMGYRRCTCVAERPHPGAPMTVRSVVEHDEG